MIFHSILFESVEDCPCELALEPPPFFVDLNLDQVIDDINVGKQEYNLKPFFYAALHNVNTIHYRQEVAQDLENETLLENIKSFAYKMVVMRRYLGMLEKLDFHYHREGWLLEAAIVYCDAVHCLVRDLSQVELASRGLLAFRRYVTDYAGSPRFTVLQGETDALKAELATVKYCIIIKENRVRVRRYESEGDYSIEVEQIFEKFKQGAVKDHRVDLVVASGMNHVGAQILDFVAKLFPSVFSHLDQFCAKHGNFLDETIRVFDREIQFYVSYLDYIARLRRSGLPFCYPRIIQQDKEVYDYGAFDIALAQKRISENAPIVLNDFHLKDKERIIVVSGPNQGGKTTFARAFGQLHFLASLGFPVPGRKAQLFLFDQLFTHFEKEEDIRNLRGKLQDDLVRMHQILGQATPSSVIIMNEIFTSTTLKDAIFLSKKILEQIIALDSLCVCVTFIDELASLSEKTISMVSTVVPENPALRTFKIIRKPADGLAYAISIAEKHRLTYESLKERIPS